MDDRFAQQLKKGVLEMLVLHLLCCHPTYGYELLTCLRDRSGGRFTLKEGTLYPILYRLEDDGFIAARWSQGEGRSAPKKFYEVTESGRAESARRLALWKEFGECVNSFIQEGTDNDGCR